MKISALRENCDRRELGESQPIVCTSVNLNSGRLKTYNVRLVGLLGSVFLVHNVLQLLLIPSVHQVLLLPIDGIQVDVPLG